MTIKEPLRTGGRSARVQQSIHRAVHELSAEQPRSELSVPLIAARAGVTPSTIYRRWGDLTTLLADVAVERLRPDAPIDRGSLEQDLLTWSEMYLDDMSSTPGREMMRDVAASQSGCQGKCAIIIREQLQTIIDRALTRGESSPTADQLLDAIVAPTIYRILYSEAPPTLDQVHEWVATVIGRA